MTSDEFTNWRRASYSAGNANCVAVAAGRRNWCQASNSGGDSNGVEAGAGRRTVGIRDTKQEGNGPVLEFPAHAWQTFVTSAKTPRVLARAKLAFGSACFSCQNASRV
jgi:hypothetical protein